MKRENYLAHSPIQAEKWALKYYRAKTKHQEKSWDIPWASYIFKKTFFLTFQDPTKTLSTDVLWHRKQITTIVAAVITAERFAILESYKISHKGTRV